MKNPKSTWQSANRNRWCTVLRLSLSFLPFLLFSQGIESSRNLEIKDRCLVPDKTPVPVFTLDFSRGAKWEKVLNLQKLLDIGYGEKLGRKGFFLAGPNSAKSSDTAWQLQTGKFSIRGMSSLSGTIDFHSSRPFKEVFTPYRNSYVNSIFWFSADGKSLGRTAFPVVIKKQGHNPVSFRMSVPGQAVMASLSLGADSPNLKKSDSLLISRIRLEGAPVQGGSCFTKAEAVLPPARFVPGKPVCSFIADTPAGTSITAETAFASDKNGAPAKFSDFGPADRPAPKGTAWVKCRMKFLTDGKARPSLRSVTVCGKTIAGWKSLTAEKAVVIRRNADRSASSKPEQNTRTKPVFRRLSKSPSAELNQPFVFSVSHDMPLNWRSLRVVLNGKDISAELKQAELPVKPPMLDAASFTYTPEKPFAMRKIYKAVVSLSDIYGASFSRTLYFFFDEPLTRNVVTLRDDGVILVDGKPFFPLGAPYVNPLPVNGNNLDNAYAWLRKAGFNLTVANPMVVMRTQGRNNFQKNFQAYLDKIASYGIKTYFPPGNTGGANCRDTDAILRTVVEYYRHPALLVWYIGDDTLSHNTPEEMELKIEAIRAVDPYHPTCQADAVYSFYPSVFSPVATADDPSRFRPVVNFTDIFRAELYPVRNFSKKNAQDCVPSLIADMRTIQRDISDRATGPKSIWGIVQYFEGWGKSAEKAEWKRYPTWQELRAMTWATVIYGAKSVNWYSYTYSLDKFAHGFMYKEETRKNILRIMGEIVPLVDVLLERAAGPAPAVTILDGPANDVLGNDSICVMARKHGGHTYLFALNSACKPVKARITAPGTSGGTVLYENDRRVEVRDGALTDDFQPNEVHIYKLK